MNDKKKMKQQAAAALRYENGKDDAPRVTAKGRGLMAERIIELALKHRIPIKNDPALVEVLSKLDLDEQIPLELYRAVAEILAFVYSANEQYRGRRET
jgi:flagellar biosynthesis protein